MNGPGESPELFRAMREAQATWKECKSRATTMSDIEWDAYMMFFHAFVQAFDAWERHAPSVDDGVQPHFVPDRVAVKAEADGRVGKTGKSIPNDQNGSCYTTLAKCDGIDYEDADDGNTFEMLISMGAMRPGG